MSKSSEIELMVNCTSDANRDESASTSTTAAKPSQRKVPWYAYIWDYDPDSSVEERRLVKRLDCTLLVILCVGNFIQSLDESNVAFAYVSGMKEDLRMTGTDINYLDIVYTAGYVLGQIPSQLILTRVRSTIFLPCCMIIWSLLTFSLAILTSWEQFLALRFFIGLVEAGFAPGAIALLGSWYKPAELGKRITIFTLAGHLASILAGFFVALLYATLNGVRGIEGWRWMFLLDGLLGIPIAITTYFFLPDLPDNSKAFYLTSSQLELARERLASVGRAARGKLDRTIWKRVFGRWHVWALVPIHMLMTNPEPGSAFNPFSLWLKAQGFSITKLNIIGSSACVAPLVASLFCSTISDALRHRPLFIVGLALFVIFPTALLAAWSIPPALKWFAWETLHIDYAAAPIYLAWVNELCAADAEERFLIIAVMETIAGAISIWLPLKTWPATDAPSFHTGFTLVAICHAAGVLAILWIWQRSKKDSRPIIQE